MFELIGHVLVRILLAFPVSPMLPKTPTISVLAGIIVFYSLAWIALVGAAPVVVMGINCLTLLS